MNIASDTSLIITTYNNPPFLELVLKTVMVQHILPGEVIIADDGSTDETRQLSDGSTMACILMKKTLR